MAYAIALPAEKEPVRLSQHMRSPCDSDARRKPLPQRRTRAEAQADPPPPGLEPTRLALNRTVTDIQIMPSPAARQPATVQPPAITWAPPGTETPAPLRDMPCPNCAAEAAKSLVLTVDVQLPDNPSKRLRLLRCPACTCHFYDSQIPPDYAEPALNNRGRVPFYVQQGAGISLITRPLMQAAAPPGSAYMEVGCGYGFSLDFAINTRGWRGLGIDPAPLAAIGRDALGLPIELRYLRDGDEARGTMDAVMGSEVVEHVTSPSAFVHTLRAMLKPGGLLMLTTPNGADIAQDTPPGIIIPLLSPSLHLVIQTAESLAALLHGGGFAHVEVVVDSHSLIAFASDAPLQLERDPARLRLALRTHLEGRAAKLDQKGDLFLGLAGRAFQEAVNDGDMAAADRAWALLTQGCHARFGWNLDGLTSLPAEVATCSLERMAQLVPLNLGGLLYSRAIRRLAAGAPRASLEGQFTLASSAAAAMRRALGELAMEDGQTEDIDWTARAEALLCGAAAGNPGVIARLAALPPAPTGGVARRRGMVQRALTTLVNAGHLDLARGLLAAAGAGLAPDIHPGTPLADADRDLLFCLAVLDAQSGPGPGPGSGTALGGPALARTRFAAVRAAATPGAGLWWAALNGEMQSLGLLGDTAAATALTLQVVQAHPDLDTGAWALPKLVNAGQYGPARAIAEQSGLTTAPFTQPGSTRPLQEADRDLLFCLGVLDVQADAQGRAAGDPAMGRSRLSRVRAACEPGAGLWWAALRGELQALDLLDALDEAAALTADLHAAHPELEIPPDIMSRIAPAAAGA